MINETPKPAVRPSLWARVGEWMRVLDTAMEADSTANEMSRLENRVAALEARLEGRETGPDGR